MIDSGSTSWVEHMRFVVRLGLGVKGKTGVKDYPQFGNLSNSANVGVIY